ncbi:MAG: sulfur oxidation c-type cytochrome SoxX [Oceanicoccus sp.]
MIRVCAFFLVLLQNSISIAFAEDREDALTSEPGRYAVGQKVFNDRDRGHCLLCHRFSRSDESFQGTIGPSLDGIATRLTAQQIRYRIVDNSRMNSQTLMPAYFRTDGLVQVAAEFVGKTILSAQDIEDLVVYLVFDPQEQ